MRGYEHLRRKTGPATSIPSLQIKLDWKAYFRIFCDTHGGFPMPDRGRLLFPDGWTYSNTDYAGPEWPPSENEEERLKVVIRYWVLRKKLVREEYSLRVSILESLVSTVATHSCPLQRTTQGFMESDSGERIPISNSSSLDLDAIQIDVEQVHQDLVLCDRELKRLGIELKLYYLEIKNGSRKYDTGIGIGIGTVK